LPLTQAIKDIKPVKLPGMKDDSDSDAEAFKAENLYLTHE